MDVIEKSSSFILILSKGALDRCANKNDWLKREIMHALDKNKKIIPIILDGFEYPTTDLLNLLPEQMRVLPKLQAIQYNYLDRDSTIHTILQFMAAPHFGYVEGANIPEQPERKNGENESTFPVDKKKISKLLREEKYLSMMMLKSRLQPKTVEFSILINS